MFLEKQYKNKNPKLDHEIPLKDILISMKEELQAIFSSAISIGFLSLYQKKTIHKKAFKVHSSYTLYDFANP